MGSDLQPCPRVARPPASLDASSRGSYVAVGYGEQMTDKPKQDRDDRLKAALKANMSRRKAQAKARKSSPPNTSGRAGSRKDDDG